MEILYFKSAIHRRRNFQIKTKIVVDGGIKKVIKESIYPEGDRHIYLTFKNTEYAKKIYGDKYTSAEYNNGMLITPYYEGVSLGNKIRKCMEKEDYENELRNLLQIWRKLIIGNSDNLCEFQETESFVKIFGSSKELEGMKATNISNLDCSGENILFTNEGIKIFDYEWIFVFPVPVELIFYRMLKLFFEYNSGLISLAYLCDLAGINKEYMKVYDRLLLKFNEYISFDQESNIHYDTVGKVFIIPRIISNNGQKAIAYEFPHHLIPKNSNIVIYGAGNVGSDYYNQAVKNEQYKLVAWVDKRAALYRKQGLNIITPIELKTLEYDYLVISILNENIAEEIKKELLELGVDEDKIRWSLPKTRM